MIRTDPDVWYSERDISTTLVKGLKVLGAFDEDALHLTLPDIGRKTGFDRATVRRLVITLVEMDLLKKTDKSFSLAPKILTLAGQYLRGHGIGTTVQPILNKHSELLGQEISLATASQGAALYLARSSIPGSTISFGFTVGSRLPLFHTAIGRMLLALQDDETANSMISAITAVRYTPQTLMESEDIQHAVSQARGKGFSLVVAEFEVGISGLAVPVGRLGQAKTVIGLSAPVRVFQDKKLFETNLAALHLCAGELDRAWTEGP